MNPPLFWILALIAVASALVVILKRNPVASALALAVHLVALAGLFAGLSAAFLFAIQILVYAGAVVVLIIFVIMLLNLRRELQAAPIQKARFGAAAAACALAAALVMRAVAGTAGTGAAGGAVAPDFGKVEAMADLLFTRYLFPFEVVSLILLVGIIGAVVVAKQGE